LTAERIATLPKAEQSAWKDYLKRSERQRKADQDFLKKEMRREGIRQIVVPPEGPRGDGFPWTGRIPGTPERRRAISPMWSCPSRRRPAAGART
jgi:hypothetical protein